MRVTWLKNIVGGLLIGLHLVAVVLCFVWLKPRLEADDFRLTILILAPVATVYLLAYVRDVIKTKNDPPSTERVRLNFAILAMLYAIVFGAAVVYLIYDFYSAHASPGELKEQLALFEIIGGGVLGLLMDGLFGKQEPPKGSDSAPLSADRTRAAAPPSGSTDVIAVEGDTAPAG
jgi:hypothetical protein